MTSCGHRSRAQAIVHRHPCPFPLVRQHPGVARSPRRSASRVRRADGELLDQDDTAQIPDDPEDDAGDDASDGDEMVAGSPTAAIRSHERGRVRAILNHPAAAKNPPLALHLALDGKLTRGESIAALQAGAAAAPSRLAERMAGLPSLRGVGADVPDRGAGGTPLALARQIIEAGDKARGR